MIFPIAVSILLLQAPLDLKQSLTGRLELESYQDAKTIAMELIKQNDPEAVYLAISAFAASGDVNLALQSLDEHKQFLKDNGYFKKVLESISLAFSKKHFASTQDPLKLASLIALAQQSDVRVLGILLEAFEHPSVKLKILALKGLSGFPDEKVKKKLISAFKYNTNPLIGSLIAKIFTSWRDKRILPLLEKKLHEEGLNVEEKISYINAIKELDETFDLKKIKSFADSKLASLRLLACYLLADESIAPDEELIIKLMNDSQLLVKQAAVQTVIKKKVWTSKIQHLIASWKDAKTQDLRKIYWHIGLINHDDKILKEFELEWQNASQDWKKHLTSVLCTSGIDHDQLALKLACHTQDPLIHLQIGLYLMSGHEYTKGAQYVIDALSSLEHKRLYIVSEQIMPFYAFDDETNSIFSLSSGTRRAYDKHVRLKIFHLLAIKNRKEAKDLLKSVLYSDLFEISLDAMVSFWENFGYEDKDYLKSILNESDRDLRLKAALILSYLDYDKDSRKALMECYHKQTYSMQIQILFALSEYHDDDVIEFYLKNLKSKFPLIQAISAGCLFTALYK